MPDSNTPNPAAVPGLSLTFTTSSLPAEPKTITIDGESFDCLPWLPGGVFLHFSRIMAKGSPIESTVLLNDFFAEVMEPAEHERFLKYIADPSRRVDSKLLGNIFTALWINYQITPDTVEPGPTEPPTP